MSFSRYHILMLQIAVWAIFCLTSFNLSANENLVAGKTSSVEQTTNTDTNLVGTNIQSASITETGKTLAKPAQPAKPAENISGGSEKGANCSAGKEGHNESQGKADLFINWTAAIFGILAVVFALFVLILAIKGWSEYSKVFEKIDSEVETRLNQEVARRTTDFFEKTLKPQLDIMFLTKQNETIKLLNETIANELDKTKNKLEGEMKRIIVKDEISRQVVDLAVAEVSRRLSPQPAASTQSEFEPKEGNK